MFLYFERIVFYFFIFVLPLQLRTIIYKWNFEFNEWTSAYIYLTDILLITLFSFWALRNRKKRFLKGGINFNKDLLKSYSFWLVVFVLVSFASLAKADNLALGFYRWFKLLEMAGLFFYISINCGFVFKIRRLAHFLIAGAVVQAVIAIFQYGGQESVGLDILRESPLNHTLSGVAKIITDGIELIRAYGTMPHPNVLAGFLVLALFLLYFVWIVKRKSFIRHRLAVMIAGLLIFALGLTFSRVAGFFFLVFTLIFFSVCFRQTAKQKNKGLKRRIVFSFGTVSVLILVFFVLAYPELLSRFDVSPKEQAVTLRTFYNEATFSVIAENPVLGLGMGNFVWFLKHKMDLFQSWVHQPVHSFYLLIAVETGLLGLVSFLLFVWHLLRSSLKLYSKSPYLLTTLFSILGFLFAIGVFDHYLWSLQQGQLMLWLSLGLLAANASGKKETL